MKNTDLTAAITCDGIATKSSYGRTGSNAMAGTNSTVGNVRPKPLKQ